MSDPKRVIVLGSTGSIGRSTLDVLDSLARNAPDRFRLAGLAAGRRGRDLAEQAARFGIEDVALADPAEATALAGVARVRTGTDAARQLVLDVAGPDTVVVAAMVGAAGIPATLAALERGAAVALANKETLVAAGDLVMPAVRAGRADLRPVDSEHAAIAHCWEAGPGRGAVRRVVLTASGGPFRTWPKDRIDDASVEAALDHPTWTMGRKITIDSASMMNKALEVIEAHWLFDLPADRIEVVVHPQSVVHGFVEFVDGAVVAQLSPPDMRTAIQQALTWPERVEAQGPSLDWTQARTLTFEPLDETRFPAVALARRVIALGGTAGAALNAANEVAVAAFLAGRIPFGRIVPLVAEVLEESEIGPVATLEDVLRADRAARERADSSLRSAAG